MYLRCLSENKRKQIIYLSEFLSVVRLLTHIVSFIQYHYLFVHRPFRFVVNINIRHLWSTFCLKIKNLLRKEYTIYLRLIVDGTKCNLTKWPMQKDVCYLQACYYRVLQADDIFNLYSRTHCLGLHFYGAHFFYKYAH